MYTYLCIYMCHLARQAGQAEPFTQAQGARGEG